MSLTFNTIIFEGDKARLISIIEPDNDNKYYEFMGKTVYRFKDTQILPLIRAKRLVIVGLKDA